MTGLKDVARKDRWCYGCAKRPSKKRNTTEELLLEGDQDDLGMGSHAHWGTPGAASAGCVNLHLSEPVQAVRESSKCTPGHETEWEDLAAMGVTGELEADSRVFGNRQAIWDVIEEDAGRAALESKAFKKSSQVKRRSGIAIRHTDNVDPVNNDTFVVEYANSGTTQSVLVVVRSSERFVISANKVSAQRWREFPKRSCLAVGIDSAAVVEITGNEENRGVKLPSHGCNAAGEGCSIDVAKVEVTDKQSGSSAPAWGQVRQTDRDTSLPDLSRVHEAIERSRERDSEKAGGDIRPGGKTNG